MAEDLVQSAVEGRLGIITLNRPKALNALNLAMVEQIDAVLAGWETDPAIDAVLIRSAVERAFCAGGDVRSIGILPEAGEREALARAFFGTEYRLNHRINRFPKPYIALINGIAMGGGLGLSIHGSHRIVSETVRMAMPETVLGLFPDVGGTWFLHRCPGAVGRYLALIGPQIGAADALAAGLATHHVPGTSFPALIADLVGMLRIDEAVLEAIIARHATVPEQGALAARIADIDRLFGVSDLDLLVEGIRAEAPSEIWVAEAAGVLERASPTSLKVTWQRMIDGAGQTIERVLQDDYRIAVRIVQNHDFVEGVRAILVDKDHAPEWCPAQIADVKEADIEGLLAPLEDELPL
ncbi:enoyl-CoA hydratase/isomerase family protein [Novosphingobium rosa]|uniref:enoyl-CoA hydratase/isomerase family protein n=1 Tax=Novosphingobium rosa TaxID=76978 RepID=UPI0008306CE1|nr:enoyl-CoA hydratase/isomerase family protein [Novosphingobium rosa]